MKGISKSFVSFIRNGLLLVAMVIVMVALPGFSSRALAAEYPDYLSFTAVDGDVTIGMNKRGNPDDYMLEYSKDRQNWTSVTLTDTNKNIVTIPSGETYYFRTDRQRDGLGKGVTFDKKGYYVFHFWSFLMSGKGLVKAGGNIMSLLDPTCEKTSVGEYAFEYLFIGCGKLMTAPKLPAQTLARGCYRGMFQSCSSLTEAPKLPAQTLADSCYQEMFQSCSSLTKAPELPAQTLADSCYAYMFTYCKSLTKAPELPAQTLADYCYSQMFVACALKEAPELPAQTLADSCYTCMFYNCSSLTKAPELPAQTLTRACYQSMFWGCDSLTEAPELPARTLSVWCYNNMFSGCTKLSSVTVGFAEAETPLRLYLSNWLGGVSETGTLLCPESLLKYTNEELCLPAGWVKKEQTSQPINSFVTRMYQQCLSREPDEAGLAGWVEQLATGQVNGAQIAEAFVFSNEMLNKNLPNEEFIKVLYRAMMGREADEAGLAGWMKELTNDYSTRSEVTKAFVESAEFTAICESYGIIRGDYVAVGDIERFVTRFYTICLGRPADQKGHWGWVVNLRDKKMNGAQIAEAFFFSEEFVNKNVSDEVYIATLYRTILGREADETGLAGWVEQLQNNQMTRKDILGAFIESTEFTGLCAGYGIERGSL